MEGETSCVGPGACYTVVKRQYRDYHESVLYTDLHSHNKELNSPVMIISDSFVFFFTSFGCSMTCRNLNHGPIP